MRVTYPATLFLLNLYLTRSTTVNLITQSDHIVNQESKLLRKCFWLHRKATGHIRGAIWLRSAFDDVEMMNQTLLTSFWKLCPLTVLQPWKYVCIIVLHDPGLHMGTSTVLSTRFDSATRSIHKEHERDGTAPHGTAKCKIDVFPNCSSIQAQYQTKPEGRALAKVT